MSGAPLAEALRELTAGEEGEWRILARPDHLDSARSFLARGPVAALVASAGREAAADVAEPQPASGRGASVAWDGGGGRRLVVKALLRGGLPSRLGSRAHGPARLVAELAILDEALRRGVPTARAAFGASRGGRGRGAVCLLATEEIPGARSLASLLSRRAGTRGDRAALLAALEQAGRAVRRAHDLGLDHADLNIGNVLVAVSGEPAAPSKASGERPAAMGPDAGASVAGASADASSAWVIDLGLSRIAGPPSAGRRAANLIRLLRSAEKHLGSDPARLRQAAAFLRGYLRGPGSPRPGGRTDRAFRRRLHASIRRRLPLIALHRLGWRRR